ncbi:MAG: hypothetical protein KGI98_00035 [Euryarchaeota archaeon]|nr:hypothetical protein [Euryarchaeota archaeon]MDE1879608.1 hypothetical protein [Euryarchaeota archaeon]
MTSTAPGSRGPARRGLFEVGRRGVRSGLRWSSPLIVRRFPQEVAAPALGPLGSSDLRVRTTVRLRCEEQGPALHRVQEDRAHVEAELATLGSRADPRSAVLRQEAAGLEHFEEALASRRTRLWDVVVAFEGWGRSEQEAVRAVSPLREALHARGFRFHATDFQAEALCVAPRPLGPAPSELFHALPEEGVAALLPLWEDRLEERGGVLVGLHAMHGTPIFLDRFQHPSHSSAIFGETGSGKSYASALGWIRLRWFRPDLSVFVLDPLGGLAHVVSELGGSLFRAGDGALALNPLDPATTGGDVRVKAAQVGVMFRALFPSLADEEVALLDTTLSKLYDSGGTKVPLLRDLVGRLEGLQPRPARLLTLLERATRGSLRGLDRPTNLDLSSRLLGFDLSAVTAEELPFFLTLLLDLVYGEVRRRPGPKIVVLDEAHYLARAPATAAFLDHLVRHVRHFEAGIELLSQDPEDFLREETGRTILQNLDSVLLLRLKDGGEAIAPLLGLHEGELDFLRQAALPGSAGYSQGILRTAALHLPLAVISSEAEDRLLRRAFARERTSSGPRSAGRPLTPE